MRLRLHGGVAAVAGVAEIRVPALAASWSIVVGLGRANDAGQCLDGVGRQAEVPLPFSQSFLGNSSFPYFSLFDPSHF
jgi:hypothetical protein